MTTKQAESYLSGFSGALPVLRTSMIRALTASDQTLIRALKEPKSDEGLAAAIEAGRRHKSVLLSAMAEGLPKCDYASGVTIVKTLAKYRFGMKQIEHAALSHPIPVVRWQAAVQASNWGYKPGRITLSDAVKHVYEPAVNALALVGTQKEWPALRRYIQMLHQGPPPKKNEFNMNLYCARKAECVLAKLKEPQAIKQVRIWATSNSDFHLQTDAVLALGKAGVQSDTPILVELLNDKHMNVRFAAAEALGQRFERSTVANLKRASLHASSDSANGKASDAMGRQYMAYVADELSSNRKPLTQREWNLTLRPNYLTSR